MLFSTSPSSEGRETTTPQLTRDKQEGCFVRHARLIAAYHSFSLPSSPVIAGYRHSIGSYISGNIVLGESEHRVVLLLHSPLIAHSGTNTLTAAACR